MTADWILVKQNKGLYGYHFFYWIKCSTTKQAIQKNSFWKNESCVYFLSPFFVWEEAAAERKPAVSEAPSKRATGHSEWCLFMTHFNLHSAGREKLTVDRGRPVLTREELCEDRGQQCACQENKVAVKPIKDGPFSNWCWLLSAGSSTHGRL